ncbi:MAG: exo-alpha-sialidase [Lentisphaerae bacterium]|jgi:hypothetical protein|nr:exo-alpha-sialidase [Lentisphaerota bacterium]MBT4814942.1 exo-alpha-sialidase [Lentisphaerota bacterium]MBT5604312.1 exo-alpha-sialidase [Lentisphaerota bacterium]MBT7060277.1 exo-alpha-sialidase [Lentisphaerota bacterium]MBT7847556.1 exo-alpha-sialidase [Lentisphaerota bacterium]
MEIEGGMASVSNLRLSVRAATIGSGRPQRVFRNPLPIVTALFGLGHNPTLPPSWGSVGSRRRLMFICVCGWFVWAEIAHAEPAPWQSYHVYRPRIEHSTVVDGDVSFLKYSHGSTVGRFGDHWICLWNANTVPIEGKPGQRIYMSTSADGVRWSLPEAAFGKNGRSVNAIPCPRGVQWQPNLLTINGELWAFWSQLSRDEHYGCYVSRLTDPDGKWENRRLLWDGRPDPVVDGQKWRVLPLANAMRLATGRILVPVTLTGRRAGDADGSLDRWTALHKRSSVLYSDDSGVTWHVSPGTVQPERTWAQWEPTVWEKADGTVMMFARNQGAAPKEDAKSLLWSKSEDGGVSWTPHRFVPLQTTVSRMHNLSLPGNRYGMVHNDWPAGLSKNRRCNLALFFSQGGGIDFAAGPGISASEPLVMYPNAWLDGDALSVSYSAGFPPRVIRVARVSPLPDPDRLYLLPRDNVRPPNAPARVHNYLRFAGHERLEAVESFARCRDVFSAGAWIRSTGVTLLDTRQARPKAGFVWAIKDVRPVVSLIGVPGEISPTLRLSWHEWNYVGITLERREGRVLFVVNGEAETVAFSPSALPLVGERVCVGNTSLAASALRGFRGHLRALAVYGNQALDGAEHRWLHDRFAGSLGTLALGNGRAPSEEPVFQLDAADSARLQAVVWPVDPERGVTVVTTAAGAVLRFAGESSAGVELSENDRSRGDVVELLLRFWVGNGNRHTICTIGDADTPARVTAAAGRVHLRVGATSIDAGPVVPGEWTSVGLATGNSVTSLRVGYGESVSVPHTPVATWMYLGEGYPPNGIPDLNRFEVETASVRSRVKRPAAILEKQKGIDP